jgi:hypothetical protein
VQKKAKRIAGEAKQPETYSENMDLNAIWKEYSATLINPQIEFSLPSRWT